MDRKAQEIPGNGYIFATKKEKTVSVTRTF